MHYVFTQNKQEIKFKNELKKLIPLDNDSNATIFAEKNGMGVGINGNGQLILK